MKRLALGAAVTGILVSVVALGACRREEPCCQPLKLGGPVAPNNDITILPKVELKR